MAEIVTDQQICQSCGVEVRQNSMFCYNCGGNVGKFQEHSPAPHNSNENGANEPVETPNSLATSKLVSPPQTENFAEIKEEISVIEEKNTEQEIVADDKKTEKSEEPKLKSAATMRRQTKTAQRQEVEVVWEKPESDSLVRLLLVTLLMLAFVAAVVYFGVYLK